MTIVVLGLPIASAEGMTTALVQYDYEHDARGCPYQMCPVDSDRFAGAGQIITMPAHAQDVCGMRFKATRVGSPGRLIFRLGRTTGGAEIAGGAVSANDVLPLYELLYGGDFPAQKVVPGEKLYLTLRAERGKYPEDYYLVYGPRPGQGAPKDAHDEPISPSGKGFSLSFRLLTSIGPGDPSQGEERFVFVREALAPPYSHAPRVRDPDRKPHADETTIDGAWTVVGPPPGNPVFDTAIGDLKTYLERCLNVRVGVEREKLSPETLRRDKVIVIGDAATLPQFAAGLKSPESYRVKVDATRIILGGADDRGAMRAIYYLEDVMGLAAGPYVQRGGVARTCLFSPRITAAFSPGHATFLTELSQPSLYSDGLLWHISHQGFNAIYIYGNLEELTCNSKVFPELNDVRIRRQTGDEVFPEVLDKDAPQRRLRRLRDVVERAKRFGIDVYLYYATNYHHPVPKSFYKKHPDCQGYSWGNSMCTSNPKVQEYLAETTQNLFKAVPGVKGLVIIFDSEGFFSDAVGNRGACPRCRNRQPEDIAAEFLTIINKAMKNGRPDAELIAWAYCTPPPPWVLGTIAKLPKDVTFQSEFSKGTVIDCDGIRNAAEDYVISQIGPSDGFIQQSRAVEKAGLKLSTKTEHSYSQEFVNVPYIPIPFQFHRRIEAMRKYPIRAMLANWTHYGYVPNMQAEVMKWYSWDHEPEIDDLLEKLARRDFGAKAAPAFVEAWRHFSKAINDYPYSDPVARYPGPIQVGPGHPYYLDKKKPGGGQVRDWQNNLAWTQPWGPKVVLKYFGLLEAEWQLGISVLDRAMPDVPADKQDNARREYGVAKSILCCVRSCRNLTQFLVAREELYNEQDKTRRDAILARIRSVAEAELTTAKEALVWCEADSRVGYSSGGARLGGLYTPALIRWKINQVEQMIWEEIPRLAASYQPPTSGTADANRQDKKSTDTTQPKERKKTE